jgi:nicotinate phosphoribosyltransferase
MNRYHQEGHFSGLLTDLYELTMAAGYIQKHFDARATFELFVRHLPAHRNYMVAAGLDQALDLLENVRFSGEDISYLRSLPVFRHVQTQFFDYLSRFKFTGDVWALPEGTIFFPSEPLLRVTAPIVEAQLVETSLLSIIHLQTLVASKAARVTTAAAGRPVIEFGSRRAHGIEAGVLAARAAFVGGCEGTSNTFAGSRFGIPVYGTQAHSWIMAHDDEGQAFSNFLDVFPEQSTLLVDTYDVHAAIERIVALGRKPRAIRLDSGDVLADSRWARQRLDTSGWNDVQIFVSGDLNERLIETLIHGGACIDSFGVGTALSTSADAPSVGVIYKLVEVEVGGHLRRTAKFSEEKATYPGRKQVFRYSDEGNTFSGDVIGLEDEQFPEAEPLLIPVMAQGRRLEAVRKNPIATAANARERFLASRQRMPTHLLALSETLRPFPVRYSDRLEGLCDQVRKTFVKPGEIRSIAKKTPTVSRETIFWEVDVQADFMFPHGKLYVFGAEKLISNINRLLEPCRQGRVLVISSADAHNPEDPELQEWPQHCLKDTPGAKLIPEAQAFEHLVVPNREGFALPQNLNACRQIILEKNTLDVFDNPNTDVLLAELSSLVNPDPEFVVFGVATEHCVRCAVEGLLRRGRRVALVTDAIQSIVPAEGAQILQGLRSRGVRLLTTDQALALVAVGDTGSSSREDLSNQHSVA